VLNACGTWSGASSVLRTAIGSKKNDWRLTPAAVSAVIALA